HYLTLIQAEARKNGPAGLLQSLDATAGDIDKAPSDRELARNVAAELRRSQLSSPQALHAFFLQVENQVNAGYDYIAREASKPAWKRSRAGFPGDGSLAARYAVTSGLLWLPAEGAGLVSDHFTLED